MPQPRGARRGSSAWLTIGNVTDATLPHAKVQNTLGHPY